MKSSYPKYQNTTTDIVNKQLNMNNHNITVNEDNSLQINPSFYPKYKRPIIQKSQSKPKTKIKSKTPLKNKSKSQSKNIFFNSSSNFSSQNNNSINNMNMSNNFNNTCSNYINNLNTMNMNTISTNQNNFNNSQFFNQTQFIINQNTPYFKKLLHELPQQIEFQQKVKEKELESTNNIILNLSNDLSLLNKDINVKKRENLDLIHQYQNKMSNIQNENDSLNNTQQRHIEEFNKNFYEFNMILAHVNKGIDDSKKSISDKENQINIINKKIYELNLKKIEHFEKLKKIRDDFENKLQIKKQKYLETLELNKQKHEEDNNQHLNNFNSSINNEINIKILENLKEEENENSTRNNGSLADTMKNKINNNNSNINVINNAIIDNNNNNEDKINIINISNEKNSNNNDNNNIKEEIILDDAKDNENLNTNPTELKNKIVFTSNDIPNILSNVNPSNTYGNYQQENNEKENNKENEDDKENESEILNEISHNFIANAFEEQSKKQQDMENARETAEENIDYNIPKPIQQNSCNFNSNAINNTNKNDEINNFSKYKSNSLKELMAKRYSKTNSNNTNQENEVNQDNASEQNEHTNTIFQDLNLNFVNVEKSKNANEEEEDKIENFENAYNNANNNVINNNNINQNIENEEDHKLTELNDDTKDKIELIIKIKFLMNNVNVENYINDLPLIINKKSIPNTMINFSKLSETIIKLMCSYYEGNNIYYKFSKTLLTTYLENLFSQCENNIDNFKISLIEKLDTTNFLEFNFNDYIQNINYLLKPKLDNFLNLINTNNHILQLNKYDEILEKLDIKFDIKTYNFSIFLMKKLQINLPNNDSSNIEFFDLFYDNLLDHLNNKIVYIDVHAAVLKIKEIYKNLNVEVFFQPLNSHIISLENQKYYLINDLNNFLKIKKIFSQYEEIKMESFNDMVNADFFINAIIAQNDDSSVNDVKFFESNITEDSKNDNK